jgi:hypothetical protein
MDIGKDLLGSDMEDYKALMNDAFETFSKKKIIWQHEQVLMNRYQEDLDTPPIEIELFVLCNYNFKRSWPINISSESGDDDEQSIQLMINKEYLRQNNLLDSDGNFIYNEGYDKFIIDGTKYKGFGDTAAGQMKDDDVFITVIVKRVQLETGDKR